jgi:hypothetical protein
LCDRLGLHRDHIAQLLANMTAFERAGPSGQAAFQEGARAYLDARERNRGPHHSLAHWRDQVIDESDWEFNAAHTQTEAAAEAVLLDRVQETVPRGL